MKKTSLAAAVSAVGLLAAPALAQTPPSAPTAAPQGSGMQTPVAAAGALTLDTPLETIAAVPAGRAVLDKYLAPLMNSPVYEMAKKMSPRQIQPLSQGKLAPEILEQIGVELAAIPRPD